MKGIIMSSEDKRKLLLEKVFCEAQSKLAYYDLLTQGEAFRQHLDSLSGKDSGKIEEIDRHFLKGFLSYSRRLYTTGKISKSAYISLVTQTAEFYAERLVESKLAKALEKYELYFEKALSVQSARGR
jgi:hypothetical protein